MDCRKITAALVSLLLLGAASASGVAVRDTLRMVEALLPSAVRLLDSGQYDEAEKVLTRLEQLSPDNDAVNYYYGILLLRTSRLRCGNDVNKLTQLLSDAENRFAKAMEADSTNQWYKRKLADLAFTLREEALSEKLYRELLEKDSYDAEIISHLADLCIGSGRFEEADSLLGVVEQIVGKNELTDLSRMDLLRQKGDFPAFFKAMDGYIRTADASSESKCDIIRQLINTSDPRFNYNHLSDYNALVQSCMETYPADTSVKMFAAGFYYSMNQDDKVLKICGDNPENLTLSYMRYAVHMRKEDFSAALQDCKLLLELSGDDTKALSDVHCSMADCYQHLSSEDAAYREYRLAIKLYPENIVALNNYAYYMSCNGKNLGKCLKMSKKAIDAEPENPTYLDTYGWVLFKKGEYREAKAVFKKAMLYGGKESAEVLLHYAEVLDALGESSVAEGYRSQAELKMKDAGK